MPVLGQNLVLNPSFEVLVTCPDDLQQFSANVKHWTAPSRGSTDIFAQCTEFIDIKAGNNYQGSQLPKDGSNYAGCYFYGFEDYREYIQGTLSDSLQIGSKYKIRLWVSLADKSDMAIADIQMLFIDKTIETYTSRTISLNTSSYRTVKKQLITFTDQIITHKEDWVLLEQEFMANKKTSHFIIGNFNSNRHTKKKNQKFFTRVRKAYYYIDDVSVINIDPVLNPVITKAQEPITPTFDTERRYTFKNLQFEFDRWNIQKISFIELRELANHLKNHPKLNILIEGHTDEKGSENYNLNLALNRVESVKTFFTQSGISPKRIEIVSHGESKPKQSISTISNDQQNRRVEFTLRPN
jgi:outer membrane protein OmpA-like peptidoglycan-associated protein